MRHLYLEQVETFFNEFVTAEVELAVAERERIWGTAVTSLTHAFDSFNVEGLSAKNAPARETQFKQSATQALHQLLLGTIAAMDAEQLEIALGDYVHKQQEKWAAAIGEKEFRNYQRLLLLNAIDREWRDYLTAMDDLRREVGLEALGQRDPKVQYKLRSAEMFKDMRSNIEKDIADRFFRDISQHQTFKQQQEAEQQYQLQAREAGFSAVKREGGKGVELRRDVPKVGRNDLCPCGSGKKYKNCHMRHEQPTENAAANGKQKQMETSVPKSKSAKTK
jgi:preprotein translocase subunit SecA